MNNRVIFVALTSYQFFISFSYAKYISDNYEGIDIKIITVGFNYPEFSDVPFSVIPIRNLNNNKLYRIWRRLYFGGRLFRFCSLNKLITNNIRLLFVFNDTEPITAKIIREVHERSPGAKISVIDEGIGLYSETVPPVMDLTMRMRVIITPLLGSPIQLRTIGDNDLIDIVIAGYAKLYSTLRKAKGKIILSQNKELLFYRGRDFLKYFKQKLAKYEKRTVIYLGQTFDEYGRLIDRERVCLNELISSIDLRTNIVIKPHPRDIEGKYDDFISDRVSIVPGKFSKIPVEILISILQPVSILSFRSSAGINIANTFSKLSVIFLFNTSSFYGLDKDILHSFCLYDNAIYSSKYDNIYIPNELEEVNAIIQSKKIECYDINPECYSFPEIDYCFEMSE